MRLVWSQPRSATERPRRVLLLSVVCIFLGFVIGDRPEAPRPMRAATASLLATGALFFCAGVAGLALQKGKKSASLSLAAPNDSSAESVSDLQEEEQR